VSQNEVSWMTKHRKQTGSDGTRNRPNRVLVNILLYLPCFHSSSLFRSFLISTILSITYVISPYSSPKRRSKQHGIHCREACVLGGTLPQNRIVWNNPEWLQPPIWTSSTSKICEAVQAERKRERTERCCGCCYRDQYVCNTPMYTFRTFCNKV
jgi:hypothetical protein